VSGLQKEGVPPRPLAAPCILARTRMSDLSFFDPPIEIAAGSPRLEMILSRLRYSGMRPYPASHPIDFSAPDPLLIDIPTATRDVLDALSRAAMVQVHRQIVLVDTSGAQLPSGGETVLLRRDHDLGALKSRLTALARRAVRLREAEIRRDTASALGIRIPSADLAAVPSLLYIGEGSPLFLSLQGPLRQREIDLTAAISRDTARQYMAERRFAAALVDLDSFRGDASATARWIAEENGLGALPIIALSHPDLTLNDSQNTVIALATEVVDVTGRMAHIVSLIETVCRRLVAFTPVMPHPAQASVLADFTTGLFSRRFMELHIARQMEVSTQRADPLCVLTFRLDPALAVSRPAQLAFADIIRRQIRDADCPALMQPGVFAISLPATPYRGGMRLAERISDAAARHPGFSGQDFAYRVIEKRAYHSADTLLSAGLTGPMLRPRLAA
jgi:GGDEF domain-containing protein